MAPPAPARPEPGGHLLVWAPERLGDLIQAQPVLETARLAVDAPGSPWTRLSVLVRADLAPVFSGGPLARVLVPFGGGGASGRSELGAAPARDRLAELAQTRNQADALVHATRKSLTEYGDKLEAGEKEKIEAAITDLEGAIKSGDKADIDNKTAALTTAAQKLGEKMYADMQAQQAGGAGAEGGAQQGGAESSAQADDVVDADFKEVKDAK